MIKGISDDLREARAVAAGRVIRAARQLLDRCVCSGDSSDELEALVGAFREFNETLVGSPRAEGQAKPAKGRKPGGKGGS